MLVVYFYTPWKGFVLFLGALTLSSPGFFDILQPRGGWGGWGVV